MTAVALQDATLTYAKGRGIAGVTAKIPRGQAIALLGSSGSGKTTLLGLIAGTLAPASGTVTTLGRRPSELGGRAYQRLRTDVGLLYQSHNLTPGLRVIHNVLMGRLGQWSSLRALGTLVWPRSSDVRDARHALARVELADRLWSWPDELSGGERQRVALARLALQRPELWLADEPTGGLDVRLRREMLDLLIGLVREQSATLIVALHDLDLVNADFDQIWGLRSGRLAVRGAGAGIDRREIAALYQAGGA